MTAAQRAVRVSKLEAHHVTALNTLTAQPPSLAQIAAGYGVSVDAAEKHLSILIDEMLCARTKGSRITATYTLV